TTARISVPRWVPRNSNHSSTQTTRVNTRTNTWSNPSRTSPPNWSERPLTIRAPVRTIPVQILKARPSVSRNTPRVATSFADVDADDGELDPDHVRGSLSSTVGSHSRHGLRPRVCTIRAVIGSALDLPCTMTQSDRWKL